MALAKLLSSGAKLSGDAQDEAERRGVVRALSDLALMEAYGSYSEYLAAPRAHVTRSRLALAGRAEAQREELDKAAGAGGGGTSNSANAKTSSSSYQGTKKRPILPQM